MAASLFPLEMDYVALDLGKLMALFDHPLALIAQLMPLQQPLARLSDGHSLLAQ